MTLVPDANCADLDEATLKAIAVLVQMEILRWALGKDVPSPIVVIHDGRQYAVGEGFRLKLRPWGSEDWSPVRSKGTAHLTDEQVVHMKSSIVFNYAASVRDNGVCTWKLATIPIGNSKYHMVVGIHEIMSDEELEAYRATLN